MMQDWLAERKLDRKALDALTRNAQQYQQYMEWQAGQGKWEAGAGRERGTARGGGSLHGKVATMVWMLVVACIWSCTSHVCLFCPELALPPEHARSGRGGQRHD